MMYTKFARNLKSENIIFRFISKYVAWHVVADFHVAKLY